MKSLDSFPRVSLGVFPTPIQKLENTSKLLHTNVYVKRDDLTGLGLGGNKTRKLEFLLADAKNRGAEIVFTTGGATVGDYDFAASTAQAIGAEPLFWKVRMKPGGALLVSRLDSKLLVSLSGNPAAALMSLLVVLRPWLMALTGSEDRACFVSLPLKEDMPKTAGSLRLLRGHLDFTGGGVSFAEHEGRGNGNIASFAHCEVIGLIPGDSGPLKKGDVIQALRLPPELC